MQTETDKRSHSHHELLDKAARLLPGGTLGMFGLPADIAVVPSHGKGARLYDVDGNEYIDLLLGSGPLILGHAHPRVVRAVAEQASRASTFYFVNEPTLELAELIVSALPSAEKVRFCSSGNEATFFAMRLARAHTGREKVLKFEGAFHGVHDYAALSTWPASPYSPLPAPDSAGIPKGAAGTVLVSQFNDKETTERLVETHHRELAAVIVEPFQRSIPPAPGFLAFLREITTRYGITLIFDEVVTGFRFSWAGAQGYYGVTPDLTTLGKIIGGGYPVAAVAGRADILDHCDNARKGRADYVYMTGTLSGNPVGAAAGVATLKELRERDLYRRIHSNTEALRSGLQGMLSGAGLDAQVIGEGGVLQVVFTARPILNYQDVRAGDRKRAELFSRVAIQHGLFMAVADKIYLSAVHTDEDIQQALAAFKAGVNALAG